MLWHQENQGPGVAMNRATQYAIEQNFPLLARMDADDISLRQRLETQISLLEKYPAAAACSANCHYIDVQSEQIVGSSTVSASPNLIRWEIAHGLRGLIQGACVFRTGVLAAIGGYRSQFKRAEEADLFLRLADQNELRNCSEFLYNIRINANSLSLQDVHQNALYQFFALDWAKNRSKGEPERDFDAFLQFMSSDIKFRIWREEYLLNLWRTHMHTGHLPALLLAALLDPQRVWIRGLRKLDELKRA